ncbi:MAG: chromosome segregation protein SMC [Clostridiales bacterium]|nr:chromosome segregation protein SMC [Clostridiales bacterium]
MLLMKLEMQGFKSFPDKTTLDFGRGITAVVGPNGSGKSNISDAVRWVLGETSTKSLRGSKMEDVIFGGTSNRKALGFAQVKLTLDNSDKMLKEYGDTLTVARRYYRSGESEYFIDAESVRRRDIHELFMDTGLGADGYSIVSQGKIDSIISAKNEERRELFEEAAGISRFRHKRTDAERRLAAADENLVRLLDILNELESRVGPLKEQSEKASNFIELSNERKNLEIGIWLNRIGKFTNDLREQEHKIDAANSSYEQCENELKAIENQIESDTAAIADINVEIENIRNSGAQYEEEALRAQAEISVIKANVTHGGETIERLGSDISASSESSRLIDEQIKEKIEFIEKSNALCAEKRALLENSAAGMETLVGSENEFSLKAATTSKKISELTLSLSDCKIKYSQAQSSADEIESRRGSIDKSIAEIESSVKETEIKCAAKQKETQEAQRQINELTNVQNGYQIKLSGKERNLSELKEKLAKKSRIAADKEAKAKMLLELEKNMEGYSGAVKAVVRAAEAKKLSGICSPLSMAIRVKKEYLTAIEVSLGAAMQNIITETEQDAKNAINFLKNNNLGRATFLPVSRIKGRSLGEKNLSDNFGFVALASELVECDKKYREIIDNLLAKVVVAQDMDSALLIAKKYANRFKIVTLDGQVINAGGSMTGGSGAKGLGMLSRKNMIEDLLADVKSLSGELESLSADINKLTAEKTELETQIKNGSLNIQTLKEGLIRLQGEQQLLANKAETLGAQKGSLLLEKENASGRIKAFLAERDRNKALADDVQKQIDDAEAQLTHASENARSLSEKREKLRQDIEQINLELTAMLHDVKAAESAVLELKQRAQAEEFRRLSIEKEIANINEQNSQSREKIAEIEAKSKQLRSIADGTNAKVGEKINERNLHEKHAAELRVLEREKIQERERTSGELVRLDERKIAIRKEYDELNDMLFEQYELTRREAEGLGIVISDMPAARKRLNQIKASIKSLGSINVGAIEEYKVVSKRYEFLKAQLDDVEKSKKELSKIISDLTSSMSEKFILQFKKINEAFKTCFSDFFGGGRGELVLEDPDNCLECPIEIKIQPPGKSVQNINLFSGGEKSLAAMALLFSVLSVTPSPFCVYDEVEASLDEINVERFAKYMRKMTDSTQFIAITHRRGTMEEADVLYGVTMQEKGVSKLLRLESAQLAADMGIE